MRWENERYVRLYTRDSESWKALPWQARCVLMLVLRKLDTAGNLDLGDDGFPGLAALLDMPAELVQAGFPPLVRTGAFAWNGREYESNPRRLREIGCVVVTMADEANRIRAEAREDFGAMVFVRDGFKCVYCGATSALTIDHVVPVSCGGRNDPSNLVTACRPCNSSKGARAGWTGRTPRRRARA